VRLGWNFWALLKSLVSKVLEAGSNLETLELPSTILLVSGTAALKGDPVARVGMLEGQAAGRTIHATDGAGHPCVGRHIRHDRPLGARNEIGENLRPGHVQRKGSPGQEGNGGVEAQGTGGLRSNLLVRRNGYARIDVIGGGTFQLRVMYMNAVVQMAIADSLGAAQPRSRLATPGTFSHIHFFLISVISDVSTQSALDVVVRSSARSTTVRTNLRSLQGS
jgi:hypothetical protein